MMTPNETDPRVGLEARQSSLRNRLSGDVQALQFYFDHPRPPAPVFLFENASRELDLHLRQQITSLCGRTNATLDVFLLAVFEILLFRYTHQENFIFRSIVSDNHRQLDSRTPETIASPVAVYANLDGDPRFSAFLKRLTENVREAPMRQDYPFEKIQRGRNIDQADISRVMFVIAGMPNFLSPEPIREDHLTDAAEFINQCDLMFSLSPSAERLTVTCQYDAELFEASTIERMVGHFQTLLEGIVRNPEQRISELPLLTEAETQQLLFAWNDTRREYPENQCIHELFETQVEKTPDAVAVVFDGQQLTYRELNNRANQLAHYLNKLGVGPEVLVGLSVERSMEMIVGLLGILKAGGAYVPLDPNYPEDRLKFILSDSRVSVLLTKMSLGKLNFSSKDDSDGLPVVADSSMRQVCFDRDRSILEQESRDNLTAPVQPHDLAYVIYTSGSTGTPKGVAIEHRQTMAFLSWALSVFTPEELSGVFASTSICFDLSVFEIFAPLSCGGTVVGAQNALALASLPEASKVMLLTAVPSVVNELLNLASIPSSVRVINLAGEPLRTDLVWRICESSSVRKVHDLYGPSECTTYSTWTVRTPQGPQTIGRPIANTQIYILDGSLNPVPVGVVGEIYIGGAGVARGYLNRPELTAEKFVPDPFGKEPGARLYKSGDIARYLPDGNIEFLGRMDDQVKVRGYRIELGEVEATLARHPSIRESVVLAREDSPGDKRLVAYAVAASGSKPSAHDLHSFLQQKLPDYMVPSRFMFLQSLPLNANGKLDRKALPAPDKSRPELEQTFVAPRTPVEETLARIWAGVLKLDQVGVHDNFFELGGHSLLATQMISRVRDAFKLDLPLRSLFEAPTIYGFAQRVQELGENQDVLQETKITRVAREPYQVEHGFPLSFAQQRLWFLNQLEPDSPVYNQFKALRLRGRLNREAVQKALDTIVERHKVLRTTFLTVDGKPAQVIHEAGTVELTAIDLTDFSDEQREKELGRLLGDFTHRPFDLEKDWPLRATLIRLAGEEHILLVVMHHIASDGWSNDILFRELAALYESICQGKSCPLKDLPIQYADYAVSQKEWLQGEVLQQQLSYWKKQLKDLSPLELPLDHPRPAVVEHLGQTRTFKFPLALTLALKNLSRQEGVTLFMTLLATFQTLLHRYTGQDDIVVGSPLAGRTRLEIEGLIGFFVNTLVLRNDLSGNPTFREFLARVRENAIDAYTHQEIPFEKLVEELQPERDLSRNPFFQVMFQLRNYPAQSVSLGDVNIEEYEFSSDIAKFDLSVGLRDDVTGLSGSLEYRTDLFDQTTIERMIGHFRTLLEGVVANPEQRISELPLLTDAEREKLLVEWNDTKTDYPKDKCVQELFEAQVEKTPDAIAVVFEKQQLTYRELNNRANQLAHYLHRLGVGPEVLVGICMERSLEMMVALLGILKAGGAYVPMDPAYPKQRLAFMLDDTQAPVLLTQSWLLESFSKHGTRVICLDADWGAIAQEQEGNPIREGEAENLAYVIYTSGSTGSPKGVLIEHRQIRNYVSGILDRLGLEPGASFAMVQPLSVDSTQTVIFPSLISGGSLHVIPEDKAVDPEGIREYFLRHPIDLLKIAPSHLAALQASSDLDQVLPRCWLVIGGEAAGRGWVESLQAGAHCSILNHYGPTETTVGMLTYRVQKNRDVQSCSTIPIGRPLPNTRVYLLDRHLQPVPIGVPGELYIGGSCLARGYLNRPELTAEKFVPSPFSEEQEARLYKSGDVARCLPDGNIEFLGRTDDQIKIRGFRIEPGEIEAALADYPGVRQSVVVVREDEPNQKRLVAYVVSKQEARPTKSDLRNFLAQKLPNHMVPSAFVLLETLPRTSHGKVNRRALPTPDQNRPELHDAFVAPRTPVEETLASIWARVLKVDKIGIHDNFFELGGHSLLAIQLISRIRDTFKVDLPLRCLFEAPTVDGLAQRVQELGEKQDVMQETKITRVAREPYRVQQRK